MRETRPKALLRGAAWISLFYISCVHGVEADARDPRGFFEQFLGKPATFPCHDRPRGQRETEGICLIFEIQNDLSRHNTSPWARRLSRQRYSLKTSRFEQHRTALLRT